MMQNYDTAPPRRGMIADEMEKSAPPARSQAPQKPPVQPTGGDAVERLVLAAMKVIYTKGTSDGVVKMLQRGDPLRSLIEAALFVMKALYDTSRGTAPAQAMVAAAGSVTKLLAELAQAAGVQIAPEQAEQAAQVVSQRIQQHLSGGKPQQAASAQQPQEV